MALPKQVQKSIEEVEELEKQMQAPVGKVEDEESDTEDGQTTEADNEATEDEVVAEGEEQTPPQSTEPEASKDAWEHKYHRLQGKYDAEVPRLHQQLKELSAQLEELRAKAEKPVEKVEEAVAEKLVTDADVEEYGKEFIDLQRRIAKEAIQGDLAALKAENAKLKAALDQTGNQVGEVSFESRLHRLVPDFAQINNDPEWVAWLDTVDPIIRAPRRAVAQDAFNRGDAEAVAHYVSLFRGDANIEPVKPDRSSELKRQVQPSKTVASSAPASQKGRTYSNADIDRMFDKVVELNSRSKFDEAKKLEAEIDSAFREGRVAI